MAQNVPEFQARLEKVAAVVDTLHATEPGYSIGVTPIDTLVGHYDFVLTKTTTWTGDKASIAAFWGDTSTYPKKGSTPQYIILNRTNGAWPDSKICWSHEQGGTKAAAYANEYEADTPKRKILYLYRTCRFPISRYFDFLEVNSNGVMLGRQFHPG